MEQEIINNNNDNNNAVINNNIVNINNVDNNNDDNYNDQVVKKQKIEVPHCTNPNHNFETNCCNLVCVFKECPFKYIPICSLCVVENHNGHIFNTFENFIKKSISSIKKESVNVRERIKILDNNNLMAKEKTKEEIKKKMLELEKVITRSELCKRKLEKFLLFDKQEDSYKIEDITQAMKLLPTVKIRKFIPGYFDPQNNNVDPKKIKLLLPTEELFPTKFIFTQPQNTMRVNNDGMILVVMIIGGNDRTMKFRNITCFVMEVEFGEIFNINIDNNVPTMIVDGRVNRANLSMRYFESNGLFKLLSFEYSDGNIVCIDGSNYGFDNNGCVYVHYIKYE